MNCPFSFREGDERALAEEFLRMRHEGLLDMLTKPLGDLQFLKEELIWAVHYSDGGAQGDAGAVEILYETPREPRFLYGNYISGGLDLNAVIRRLPMLGSLDTRYGRNGFRPPYPFGGSLEIPPEWGYLYMGAMHHFYARKEICGRTAEFVRVLKEHGRGNEVFNAVAWFCGAPCAVRTGNEPLEPLFSKNRTQPI